jgi:hypothetical protein
MTEVATSIVGVAPAVGADKNVELLINLYEQPLDSEDIYSTIHSVRTSPSGTQGDAAYNVAEWLTSLDTTAQGGMLACSMEGTIHVYERGAWHVIPSGCDGGLNHIFALNADAAYAVSIGGQVVGITGRQTRIEYRGAGTRLNSIHGCSPSCIYAVGDDGLVVHSNGSVWSVLEPLTNVTLLAVLCLAADDTYVAGAMGMFFHWNGSTWKRLNAPPHNFTSIARYNSRIYVAAGKDGVHVLEGDSLEQAKQLVLYRLRVIDDLMYGVGGSLIAWFNGSQWTGGAYAVR